MDRIDIVITTYNRLSYLRMILDCIENQNCTNDFRYIFSDAGSTDGTQEFLKNRYAKSEEHIVILPKGKVQLPLNESWDAALQFVDSDPFIVTDDDVLVYGKDFIIRMRDKLFSVRKHNIDVLLPRCPRFTNAILNDQRNKHKIIDEVFIVGMVGTHFRMCRKSVLNATGTTFGPGRREHWFMRRIHENNISAGFWLQLPLLDIGAVTQGYDSNKPKDPVKFKPLQWGKEFLETGWSSTFTEDHKLVGIDI